MTNDISTIINATVASVAATTIFDRLPGESYDAGNDRLVKAHMIKVVNNSGDAKVCDVVDIRLAAGDDWSVLKDEGLTFEGTDGIIEIEGFKHIYWILNGLHDGAGSSWDEIKASLYSDEDAWI